jgi:hypothetical protein
MIRLLNVYGSSFGFPPPRRRGGARIQSNTKIWFYSAEAGRRSPVCLI